MKILFINDCNGNEYSNPYTDLGNLPPDKIKEIQATVLNPFHKVL